MLCLRTGSFIFELVFMSLSCTGEHFVVDSDGVELVFVVISIMFLFVLCCTVLLSCGVVLTWVDSYLLILCSYMTSNMGLLMSISVPLCVHFVGIYT